MNDMPDFSTWFSALWGKEPFPWQRMLAERLVEGDWPRVLDLPTASGKTACLDAAIYALAAQANKPICDRTAPRRIWFVVDRRIVVDYAFERAQAVADKLADAQNGPLKEIKERLRSIGGTERPLAVARLRGGVLRDDGWARLPSQPAIISSTVDQLGSRLLFRGYGHSARTAPIFAGLAAHDSLILLDEAHLSVPFMQTLEAVRCFRGDKWAEQPIRTPFAFCMLSATPPANVTPEDVFPGRERDVALDHPELQRRIRVSKPAELVQVGGTEASGDDQLAREATARAVEFVRQGWQRVAVVVNRVATAQAVENKLREQLEREADVVLLTGRLRPLERDRLVGRWSPKLRAVDPEDPERPLVLVATQCIEVGADFSFDALVTEAASLDALRQRFGRLNRLGTVDSPPAAILIRADEAEDSEKDPVYGAALSKCWGLLKEQAKTRIEGNNQQKVIDFGIAALDEALSGTEDISSYLAPAPDAPLLLPAHLDLLCQTSPVPHVQPDIQLYLHGAERGGPEVRVVWRADLSEGEPADVWKEVVALCPPNSLEALSVPLYRLRRWLQRDESANDAPDVEGAAQIIDAEAREAGPCIRPVLIWRGRDRSEVLNRASGLRPDELIVLPAEYGMTGLGQSAPDEALGRQALDIWEPAHLESGKGAAIRLNRKVLMRWLNCPPLGALVALAETPDWNEDALQAAIDAVLDYRPVGDAEEDLPPSWLVEQLKKARHGSKEKHAGGGLVLFAPPGRLSQTEEQDLFADDDDLLSALGREVPLDTHSTLVERAVGRLAERCLPDMFREPLTTAAYWHDAGKLDERFQIWLRQGDEPAALAGTPLAKSKNITASPARRQWLRQTSGLPNNFRHEMLSLQLAEQLGPSCGDSALDDLALYCIASHHGYGRPFAPVSLDSEPPPVRGNHDGVTIDLPSNARIGWSAPHSLASGVAERFWKLTRRHGWWGLAYLEAILRLGDWYGSQLTAETVPQRPRRQRKAPPSCTDPAFSIVLKGIDGSNPLGFLAALGTLCALHAASHETVRLHWTRGFLWQPVLSGLPELAQEDLAGIVADALRAEQRDEIAIGIAEEDTQKVIDCDTDHMRNIVLSLLNYASSTHRSSLDFVAAFTSDACIDKDRKGKPQTNKNNKPRLETTPFQFIKGSGNQYFLGTVVQLMRNIEEAKIKKVLFEPWLYADEKNSMRWDPVEDRRYALMDRDPTASNNKPRTVWMANLLAYRALALFTSAPQRHGLATTGWSKHDGDDVFTWPLWGQPAGPDVVRSLLLLSELHKQRPEHAELRPRGIQAVFRSRRIKVGEGANFKINFSPARQI